MQDLPNPPPIDGIAPPEPVRVQEEFVAPKQQPLAPVPGAAKKGINATLVLFAVASVIYLMGAMFLMATLPTPDGTMKQLVSIGTMLYALGALVWLALLVLGLMRISTFKDRPRLRFFGMIRLLGVTVPMLLISIATAVIINIPPRLQLEVIEPTQASQLVAPLSVKFGMDTALRVFDQQGLKPLKYQWDYNNDGVIDQETFDPVSTYLISKAGVYSIVSRVIMTNGQSKNVVYRLVIPRASFGLQPEQPVIDEQASFSLEHLFPKASDTKTPKLKKATWDFDGDGLIDLETDKMTATYTYHKLGTFNVAVSMTLDNQSQSSLQRVITVVEPPSQPFPIELETEPTVLLGPPPMGVLFSLKTDEPVANASWEFGDQKTGEGLRVAHVYSAVGTYSVKATVRSASGSVAILNKIVRVTNPLEIRDLAFEGEPPVKSFSVEGHVPLTVDITPTTFQPLITFSWDAPSATESQITDKHFHAIYRDTGKYYVDLIGVDPDQNVFRRRITVNALPPESVVAFSMDPAAPTAPATVKFDASDSFVAAGEEITGFEWDFGDGLSGDKTKFSGSRIDHLFQKPGSYTITLTVRTTSGEVYTGKQTLVVRTPIIDACFLPSRTTGKAPMGVRFDAECSTGAFESWLWDFGDTSQSDIKSPTHVFERPGEYNVTLTATTKDGLSSVKSATISVSE